MTKYLIIMAAALFGLMLSSCETEGTSDNAAIQTEVDSFLTSYTATYQGLMAAAGESAWMLNTAIYEDNTANEEAAQASEKALADFTGSEENINAAKKYLEQKDNLTELQVKQLEAILYMAGGAPATAGAVVDSLIKANTEQTTALYGYKFMLDGKPISTNEIDKKLNTLTDVNERMKVWEASKEVSKGLKGGLTKLVKYRNESVQALGYDNFFQYQVSDYGYSTDELLEVTRGMISDIWPLYRELHTWARYEMAKRYSAPGVPEMIPAHWLPNRWGQDWTGLVDVQGLDLDGALAEKSPEWIIEKGEEFYVSLGFPELPQSFYDKSSLYPLKGDEGYSKNNHASAWHMDLDKDVRSLMSVEPNTKWWSTTLHELGHIYYYISYSNDSVPLLLRGGANRAYHEGIGTMIGMASMQLPLLKEQGLIPQDAEVDEIQLMLKEALDYVVVIPWGAGVMTEFEHSLYAEGLEPDNYNKRWWELKEKYQGITPPNERSNEYADAASKTHINNDPAQYYDYAISTILMFQIHDHIAKSILGQDPKATNYWGNKEVGQFLMDLTKTGATVDWDVHLQNMIGSELSAQPMVDYFKPLMEWLQKENEGRDYALPETI
ncbi:MAG: M2 family metallopeptidase [Candidatus Kapaibacteriales bacterium]